jgi:hypothetical protein
MADNHLWFSIFSRPASKHFTRVEGVHVALYFFILLCCSTSCIMIKQTKLKMKNNMIPCHWAHSILVESSLSTNLRSPKKSLSSLRLASEWLLISSPSFLVHCLLNSFDANGNDPLFIQLHQCIERSPNCGRVQCPLVLFRKEWRKKAECRFHGGVCLLLMVYHLSLQLCRSFLSLHVASNLVMWNVRNGSHR